MDKQLIGAPMIKSLAGSKYGVVIAGFGLTAFILYLFSPAIINLPGKLDVLSMKMDSQIEATKELTAAIKDVVKEKTERLASYNG